MMNLIQWIKDRVSNWTAFTDALHFFASAVLVIFGVHFGLTPIQAVGVAVVIGLGKEAYDIVIRGRCVDINDMVCNLSGVFVGWVLVQ